MYMVAITQQHHFCDFVSSQMFLLAPELSISPTERYVGEKLSIITGFNFLFLSISISPTYPDYADDLVNALWKKQFKVRD